MLANVLKDRIEIQKKVKVRGALGETVNYKPYCNAYASVIPLDVKTQAQYQQLNTVAQYLVTMRDGLNITLGNYRFKWNEKTLEPSATQTKRSGFITIPCKEV